MALKKRFKKKEIIINSLGNKEEKSSERKLKLQDDIQKVQESKKEPAAVINLDKLRSVSSGNTDSSHVNRKLSCYHNINELFQNKTLSLFNLMRGVIDIICVGLDSQGGSLWILENDKLVCKVANGPGSEQLIGISVENGEGIVGWVSVNKKSQIVYDTSVDQRFKSDKFGTKTLIATPLVYCNEVIGVLEVVNKVNQNEVFMDDDKFFLEDLSTLVAMDIKTSRVLKEQEQLINRMSSFASLHETFSSTIELDELLVIVLKRAIGLLNAEVGSIWLVEDSGEGVECSYAVGPTKDLVQGLKLKRGVGLIGKIIDHQEGMIVEDCLTDKHFSKSIDEKTNFVSRTMVASPFVVKGECIGAIQILNKQGGQYFNIDDLELLNLFGSSSAMYIKNARLFQHEKKAKDLSSLIEIGKQITSTLDLDAVLLTIVNLSSKVIPFDEAQMSTKKPGSDDKINLRAISGQHEVNFEEKKNQDLQHIHQMMINKDIENVYIPHICEFDEKKHLNIIKTYLEENELHCFWAKTLKDDQGSVGVLSLESEDGYLISEDRDEVLAILTSQSTVALRNVELYTTIPGSQYLKNLSDTFFSKITNLTEVSFKTWSKLISSVAALVLLLLFVKVPNSISAKIEILPKQNTYFSQIQAKVKKIYVKEGQIIKKGDLLVQMDIEESQIQLLDKQSKKQKVKMEMLKSFEDYNIADFKIKESEYISLDYEVQLLMKKIENSTIKAKNDGVIISENLEELAGKPVNFGAELIKVASKEEVIVKFEILEEDIQDIEVNQEVKFKVYGGPGISFSEGLRINSVAAEGRQILETDESKYYMAKTKLILKEFEYELKPGMTGRGKVITEWKPLSEVVFGRFYNFLLMEVFF